MAHLFVSVQAPLLTFVTATLAPLLMSWTTLSGWPLCEATRRRSDSARTAAASCWLMKQRWRRRGREGGVCRHGRGPAGRLAHGPLGGGTLCACGTLPRSPWHVLGEPAEAQETHVLIRASGLTHHSAKQEERKKGTSGGRQGGSFKGDVVSRVLCNNTTLSRERHRSMMRLNMLACGLWSLNT